MGQTSSEESRIPGSNRNHRSRSDENGRNQKYEFNLR